MQKNFQMNLKDRFDGLSSRLFEVLDQRLLQLSDELARNMPFEKRSTSQTSKENEAGKGEQVYTNDPLRLSFGGIGSVPVDQFISALKSFGQDGDPKQGNRRPMASDDEDDDNEFRSLNHHRRRDHKSTSSRAQRKAIAPSQAEEASTADANLASIDRMYHSQVHNTRKGVWSRPIGMSKPGVKVLVPAYCKFRQMMDYR